MICITFLLIYPKISKMTYFLKRVLFNSWVKFFYTPEKNLIVDTHIVLP